MEPSRVEEVDRTQEFVPEGINRAFHAPREFEELDPCDDDAVMLRTLG